MEDYPRTILEFEERFASHLDYYLDEFTFRFNRRASRSPGKLFYRLIQQAVAVEPVKGKNFKGTRPYFL